MAISTAIRYQIGIITPALKFVISSKMRANVKALSSVKKSAFIGFVKTVMASIAGEKQLKRINRKKPASTLISQEAIQTFLRSLAASGISANPDEAPHAEPDGSYAFFIHTGGRSE